MKRILTFLMVLVALSGFGQIIEFTDTSFKNALLQASPQNSIAKDINGNSVAIDTNNDGEIQVSEANVIYAIKLLNANNISNVQEINDFINLEKFSVYGSLVYNLSLDMESLKELSFINSRIFNISLDCINIERINLSNNQNFSMTDFQGYPMLKSLILNLTNIDSINVLDCPLLNQLGLAYTNISTNSDISIDNPDQIEKLNVSNNNLTNFNYEFYSNLIQLTSNFNQIDEFDYNLENLEFLSLVGNGLSNFQPGNYPVLEGLNLNTNNISEINLTNNPSLITLDLSNNRLTEITLNYNPNLTLLNLSDNSLTQLNLFYNHNLETLYLNNNNLDRIDVTLQSNLRTIYFEENSNLKQLLLKNGNNANLILNNSFFPDLLSFQNLEYICIDDDQQVIDFVIDELGANSNVAVGNYCTFTPGGEFYEIQGTAEFDLLNDGCDVATPNMPFPNLKFDITNQEIYGTFYGNENGAYYIPVQEGEHSITPVFENSEYFTAFPTSFTANFPTDESPFIQDICISANGEHNDLDLQILPINQARPGFEASYKILYKNKGTTTLSGSVDLDFEGVFMDLVAANPEQSNFSDEELSWDFEDLMPFESREILMTFNLNTPTDTENPLNDGDILSFSASVNPVDGDETPEDNIFTLNQTVVNSYDPNDKTCLQGNSVAPEMVGEYVHYMIRFENTGSAEAVNIVVKDVINTEMFDIETLQPVEASHDFVTRIKNDNEVEFIFENINLPFDDENNDGYVTFKIKTLDTLQVGDTFENNAEIYFDFNFPIITDTAVTNIETLSIQNIDKTNVEVQLYPNPVSLTLNIKSKSAIKAIQVYDSNGNLISQTSFIGNQNQVALNVEKLPQGIYLVKTETHEGISVGKVLKK